MNNMNKNKERQKEYRDKVNILIEKCDKLEGLLTADLNAFENWNKEIDEYFDALDKVKKLEGK